MQRYALFFCNLPVVKFQFITCIRIEEWALLPMKVGNVLFYLAEATDNSKTGQTDVEKLDWVVVGTDMKLKHGRENVYLLMDQ